MLECVSVVFVSVFLAVFVSVIVYVFVSVFVFAFDDVHVCLEKQELGAGKMYALLICVIYNCICICNFFHIRICICICLDDVHVQFGEAGVRRWHNVCPCWNNIY